MTPLPWRIFTARSEKGAEIGNVNMLKTTWFR